MDTSPRHISVDFGWEFDAVRAVEPVFSHVTIGPAGLISLLATRLGLEGKIDSPAERIATYRLALERYLNTHHGKAWFANSYQVNPWAVAKYLLNLRDFMARFGWTAQLPAAGFSQRLQAIYAVEQLLTEEPGWESHSSNSPSAVLAKLRELAAAPAHDDDTPRWNLGIEKITLRFCTRSELPAIYQQIFELLSQLGVEVVEESSPKNLQNFSLYSARTEWEAATVAARVLAARAGKPGSRTDVVAGAATDVLDRELIRRGVPQLGVRSVKNRDVVGVFLSALSTPHDVRSILALLQMSFPSRDRSQEQYVIPPAVRREFIKALTQEAGVGGEAWLRAVHAFDEDLGDGATKQKQKAQKSRREVAHTLDEMIRVNPLTLDNLRDEQVDGALVGLRLQWLRHRLNGLSAFIDPAISAVSAVSANKPEDSPATETYIDSQLDDAAAQAEAAIEFVPAEEREFPRVPELTAASAQVSTVLRGLWRLIHESEKKLISARELNALVDSSLGSDGLRVREQAANPAVALAIAPGAVRMESDFVLWWAPVAETVNVNFPLISSEVDALSAAMSGVGLGFPTSQLLSKLSLESQRRAMNSARTVVAIVPEVLAGEDTELAGLASFLWKDTHDGQKAPKEDLKLTPISELFTAQGAENIAGMPAVSDAATSVRWAMPEADAECDAELGDVVRFEQPNFVVHRFSTEGNLLPEYLSHSQIDKLLRRPMEWLLEYQLLIKQAAGAEIPNGNRMVGTLMHKIAENLVNKARETGQTGPISITPEAIAAEYDRLIPHMAAELLLPGSFKDHEEHRKEVVASLSTFFTMLEAAEITITGMEVPLGKETLSLTDLRNENFAQERTGVWIDGLTSRTGKRMLLMGSRDVDVQFSNGHRGVVDLKYTGSKSRGGFHNKIKKGEATQLAVYATSVATSEQTADHVPVGFFLLKQGEMVTTNQEFFSDASEQKPLELANDASTGNAVELWEAIVRRLNTVFDHFAKGLAVDIDSYQLLVEQEYRQQMIGKRKTKAEKDIAPVSYTHLRAHET